MSADEVLDTQQVALAEWLPTSGGVRLDITANTVGHYGEADPILTMADGTTARVQLPLKALPNITRPRRAMAEPGRGAWTWAHQWMSADELVLHDDYDWTRQPRFTNSNDPDDHSPPPATSTAPMSSSASPAMPGTPRTGSSRAPPGADAPPRSTTASNTPWPTG